jgi:hypothetical protein
VSALNDTDSTKGYGYGYGYGQTVKQNHGTKSDIKNVDSNDILI